MNTKITSATVRAIHWNADAVTRQYYAALREHRFRGTRCAACGHVASPPRDHCVRCGAVSIEWIDLPIRGTLYAFSQQQRSWRFAKRDVIGLVALAGVAGFACHVADRGDAIGQDYNIVDNSVVSYYDLVTYMALLTGRRMRDLPLVDLRRARRVMIPAARAMAWLQQRFGLKRIRVFEPQSAHYISSSYWLSNRKSLATGYRYRYPDVREGLKDTIAWMREHGWLADRRRLFA